MFAHRRQLSGLLVPASVSAHALPRELMAQPSGSSYLVAACSTLACFLQTRARHWQLRAGGTSGFEWMNVDYTRAWETPSCSRAHQCPNTTSRADARETTGVSPLLHAERRHRKPSQARGT